MVSILLALSLNKACGVKEYPTMHCFVIPLHTQSMREQWEIDWACPGNSSQRIALWECLLEVGEFVYWEMDRNFTGYPKKLLNHVIAFGFRYTKSGLPLQAVSEFCKNKGTPGWPWPVCVWVLFWCAATDKFWYRFNINQNIYTFLQVYRKYAPSKVGPSDSWEMCSIFLEPCRTRACFSN